jgi:hypothetical protein
MKYGFDFNGVLSHHQWARDMANALLKDGHEVYCITAAGMAEKENGKQVEIVKSLGIPFTGIEVVAGNPHAVGAQAHFEAGLLKADVMKRLGVVVLLDDVPPVVIAVRQQGLVALHVE